MSTKIGIDGKPYDPAQRAREALEYMREFVSGIRDANVDGHGQQVRALLDGCLNAIADRLTTCDALEARAERNTLKVTP